MRQWGMQPKKLPGAPSWKGSPETAAIGLYISISRSLLDTSTSMHLEPPAKGPLPAGSWLLGGPETQQR